jgi:drug/metabolite transporter (DMT)-like permease
LAERATPARSGRSVAFVLAAATCWGTIGTAFALILDRVATDGLTVVTLRAATAAMLLWSWLALADRGALRVAWRRLPALAGFGLVTVTIFYLALIYAFEETSVAVGTVLLYVAPAIVTLGAARFLGEALTRAKLAALGLTFGGCLLVVRAYEPTNLSGSALGIALALLSAATYASYSLLGKPLLARHRAATVLAYHLLFGTLGLAAVKLVVSPTSWPAPADALGIGLITGVVTTLAPITLYTLGLRGLPASEASILATWEPAVALLLSATVLEERLAIWQWSGAGAVLVGVVVLARRTRASRAFHPADG